MIDQKFGKRILALREKVVADFNAEDWEEVGLLTGLSHLISNHPRLLRSLAWGDEDYSGNVLTIIRQIAQQDEGAFDIFERHVADKYPQDSQFVSAKPSEHKITFAPSVFNIPENTTIESDLVAVMMPFDAAFNQVHEGICRACTAAGFRCLRVDDIWEESTVIQDIFNLIFRAHVVVVDFTGKNPNVMYETGIAHTLGKHVVPISQSLDDVPFDMAHHRILKYLPNSEGIDDMVSKLVARLRHVSA
jgi:AbiJ N-terminal domain 5